MAKTDNHYLKTIDEKVTGETVDKIHTNNYYLKEISENISTGGGGSADLSNYIKKSNTAGLIKNDGTVDTSNYLTEHQDITGKVDSADLDSLTITINYTDESTSTYNLAVWSDD